ncbi:MAG: exodeoxyribonuclease VII small subunit [Bacteroidaceae bacterium]|mgnify:FL=1|nr:exodeoxyribonuclease VII small subunit [Bacteroidaceae bacterium]
MNYNESLKELQNIVMELEKDTPDIETLTEKLKRAQTLIAACKEKLIKTDEEIKQLLEK